MGLPGVDCAWTGVEFEDNTFTSVLVTPANFIQDLPPDTDYFGDMRSPLDAIVDVIGDVTTAQPGANIFIHQGWADMAPYSEETPPNRGARSVSRL